MVYEFWEQNKNLQLIVDVSYDETKRMAICQGQTTSNYACHIEGMPDILNSLLSH